MKKCIATPPGTPVKVVDMTETEKADMRELERRNKPLLLKAKDAIVGMMKKKDSP